MAYNRGWVDFNNAPTGYVFSIDYPASGIVRSPQAEANYHSYLAVIRDYLWCCEHEDDFILNKQNVKEMIELLEQHIRVHNTR